LGEYFGLDPILFRILFAVSAFFGGTGVLAYLIAWAAIPSADAEQARIDDWLQGVRQWRLPAWTVVVVGGLILWGIGFSWWAPRPFLPLLAIVVIVILLLSRIERRGVRPSSPPPPPATAASPPGTALAVPAASAVAETRTPEDEWYATYELPPIPVTAAVEATPQDEATAVAFAARQKRRAETGFIRNVTLAVLAATLVVLGICDAIGGIRLPIYFWVTGGIVLTGLLVGAVLRRTPWSLMVLLVFSLLGIVAFGNTGASLHDGVGQTVWVPTSESQLSNPPRLAFGQIVVDLHHVTLTQAHTIDVTLGAGQVRVVLPKEMNATVHAHVHAGHVTVDRQFAFDNYGVWTGHRGMGIDQTVVPPAGASGPPVEIDVHLADGHVSVERS
jgi:hypothetical protein